VRRRRSTIAGHRSAAVAVLALTAVALAPLASATTAPTTTPPAGHAAPSAAAAAAPSAAAAAARSAAAAGPGRFIVIAAGPVDAAARAARAAGATVVAVQPAVRTVVVDVAGATAPVRQATVARLAAAPAVASLSPDRAMQAMSLGSDAADEAGSMDLVADTIGARELWRRGITGAGVGVALLDTGVAPVHGLNSSDKVIVGPDLSFESQSWRTRNLDTYGHGTHMAGIIAGREGPRLGGAAYAATRLRYHGIAPDATLVSLKLADRYGAVDVSQVIAAIDWVVQHRSDTGVRIRVINLSFGTSSQQAPWEDPLSYAAEVATRYGIVVVAAAGNNGDNGYGLNNPAFNRNVIAVGATSSYGTVTTADDRVAWFSARKGGAAWWRSPDVVAPGSGIVSLRVPGSYIADAWPEAAVGTLGMRGSGTSQSAAVVSGAVALLLQQRPWLEPAQVKWLLEETAVPVIEPVKGSSGAGSIDVTAAARTWWVGESRTSTGRGRGSLEKARGGVHVTDGSVVLGGEQDIFGNDWTSSTARPTASASMWSWDGAWNGAYWTGPGFARDDGPDGTWTGRTWTGRTWTGRTWSGRTWSGRTWSDARWNGSGWTATRWPAPEPGHEFAARRWGTTSWDRP
jgi:serine protease AprX